MCFVWIWEQTAIISLYSVNWLVFISEMLYLYCVVRTRFLNIIFHVNFRPHGRCAMAQMINCRPRKVKARVRKQVSPCKIWTKWHEDRFWSKYFSFTCQYHSTNAPYSFIHLPPTLYNVFLPALQFPLSVSFHQCSILNHSSTTDAV